MKKDWLLFIDIVLIVAIGLTTLYSTVIGTEGVLSGGGIVNRQLIFIFVGFAVYFGVVYIDYRFAGHAQIIIPLYILTILVLAGLLLFGIEINNAKRWIVLGSFQLQPSEFAKLIIIMTTAWILSLRHKYNVWILTAVSFVMTLIVSILIFLEPDAGTALIVMVLWGLMVFVILPNQVRNLALIGIVVLGALSVNFLIINEPWVGIAFSLLFIGVSALTYVLVKKQRILIVFAVIIGLLLGFGGRMMWDNVLQDYQKERIEAFINPGSDTQGSGFQVDQSKVAIGSGMLFGKGFGHGTQSKLRFLPEHQTDFVFASYAEEFGLVGSLFLLGLYIFAILRIFQISSKTRNVYGMLLCVGVGVKLLLEVFVNIGMNVGLLPATGVPLPLMSAGGSIFLVTMLGLGLVQSVRVHSDEIEETNP